MFIFTKRSLRNRKDFRNEELDQTTMNGKNVHIKYKKIDIICYINPQKFRRDKLSDKKVSEGL